MRRNEKKRKRKRTRTEENKTSKKTRLIKDIVLKNEKTQFERIRAKLWSTYIRMLSRKRRV